MIEGAHGRERAPRSSDRAAGRAQKLSKPSTPPRVAEAPTKFPRHGHAVPQRRQERASGDAFDMPLPKVLVSRELFDKLMDYSCSIPSETTVGKWWKCRVDYHDASKGWLLCCYDESDEEGMVLIHRRRLDWLPWIKGLDVEGGSDLPRLDKKASFH